MPDIIIVGAGAMACALAARLAQKSDVCMLDAWQPGIKPIARDGITLLHEGKRMQTAPIPATSDPERCCGARWALVLVKSWQTVAAAQTLASCLHPEGVAVTLQNGLGNDTVLAGRLGSPRVVQGVTSIGARLEHPGRVKVAGWGPVHLPQRADLDSFAALLLEAGLEVEREPSVAVLQWRKLLVNSVINPLTALLRIPNGKLLEGKGLTGLMDGIAQETQRVAEASGIPLQIKDPLALVKEVAVATASNRSSMLQDIERGAPTEIDAINGAIHRAAVSAGMNAPYNHAMAELVAAMAAKTTGEDAWILL